ncbi:acyltransferase family protein [Exiguobacterium artemiae]|uniref:acyltransferase family protein n=1 Tax=Exiguobacterium artemiae TaxID=340145 RepID=UPI002964333D|nr:acyltransferase [Exiguobacterium sibiricum]MDW2886781.1 acyltransferase [Exiguobacterium sibiricum]
MKDIKVRNLDSINMMRGLAILMVISVHTVQQIQGSFILRSIGLYGMMGVQMFFVISAFTLCYSMDNKPNQTISIFYLKRYLRIAPVYYLGILMYLFIDILSRYFGFINKTGYDYSLLNILVNISFLNGLYIPANNNIVPGGWSIGTEMIFYLVFPALFWIFNKFIAIKNHLILLPLIILLVSILIHFSIRTIDSNFSNNQTFYYYNIFNQIPVFSIGISLYYLYKNDILKKIRLSHAVVLFIFFTLLSTTMLFIGSEKLTFFDVLVPFSSGLSFAFVFVLLQYHIKFKSEILSNLGIYSFSAYIIHFIFAVYLSSYLVKKLNFIQDSNLMFIVLLFTSSCITFFAAKFMYEHLETKFNKISIRIVKQFSDKNKDGLKNKKID